MNISEMIEQLQEYRRRFGDIQVLFDNGKDYIGISYQNWPQFVSKDFDLIEQRGPAIFISGYDYTSRKGIKD